MEYVIDTIFARSPRIYRILINTSVKDGFELTFNHSSLVLNTMFCLFSNRQQFSQNLALGYTVFWPPIVYATVLKFT